jgi:hypothetical protein
MASLFAKVRYSVTRASPDRRVMSSTVERRIPNSSNCFSAASRMRSALPSAVGDPKRCTALASRPLYFIGAV